MKFHGKHQVKCRRTPTTWRPSISWDKILTCSTALASENRSRGASIASGLTNFMWTMEWASIDMRPYITAKQINSLKAVASSEFNPNAIFTSSTIWIWTLQNWRDSDTMNYSYNPISSCRCIYTRTVIKIKDYALIIV